jgi:hypothetical protein
LYILGACIHKTHVFWDCHVKKESNFSPTATDSILACFFIYDSGMGYIFNFFHKNKTTPSILLRTRPS